jgi:hypothetical protein
MANNKQNAELAVSDAPPRWVVVLGLAVNLILLGTIATVAVWG